MRAVVDSMGRVVIPKALRDTLGLAPGTEIDISPYGSGVHIEPGSRTARVQPEADRMVIVTDAVLDDETMFALIDAGRR